MVVVHKSLTDTCMFVSNHHDIVSVSLLIANNLQEVTHELYESS